MISVVIVAYDMPSQLARTLRTFAPDYQCGGGADDYEVIVVDNGSPDPVDTEVVDALPVQTTLIRIDDAAPSPARAANVGLAAAAGDVIGLLVDGARMASPGLLRHARLAAELDERAVVGSLAWHLDDGRLDDIAWEDDGYALFAISELAGSSRRGWFGPLGESNALFLRRPLWDELGGLDEAFALPGGGLVNHDVFRRACALPATQLFILLGEGTFHQAHGGASTSGRITREASFADYEAIRGVPYEPPGNEPLYLGTVPDTALPHLERSIRWRTNRRASGTRPC